MVRNKKRPVVVITGASSGIGRATAQAFAKRGAALVVAARRKDVLEEVAQECRRADVLSVPVDVTDEEAVVGLARGAVERFGRIDVWVNNASVGLWGRVTDIPLEDVRRLIDVNLFGYLHGARAVLPMFRAQGSGVLINVGSMVSRATVPYAAPYVMSKHAVRGLAGVIRQELATDGVKGVRVCTVMPGTIDTPFFDNSANYVGRALRAMPPVYSPERVARTIVHLARFPRREVFVGNSARMAAQQEKVAPRTTERLIGSATKHLHLSGDRPQAPTPGNLYEPLRNGDGVHGRWHGRGGTALRRAATVGLGVAAGVAATRRDRKS